jgi:regulator of replication initiation timing
MEPMSDQNNTAALRREILILKDEILSLEARLSFRTAQANDAETVAAERLLEIARLGIVNKNLQQRVAELEENAKSVSGKTQPSSTTFDLGPNDRDYRDLAELMTEISGLIFEREHVHEILTRSRGLVAQVIEWGPHDTVVRENLVDEVAEYLLGDGTYYEDLAVRLKAAGLAKGMVPATYGDDG